MNSKQNSGLTSQGCNNTFQTILRGNGNSKIRKEAVPLNENKTKKFINKVTKTEIFNDEYKRLEGNLTALREKYFKNYVMGNLRSNINLSNKINYENSSSKNEEKLSPIKLRSEIIKDNPELKRPKRLTHYEKFYNSENKNKITQSVAINRNPIRSLSMEELNEENVIIKLKNQNRTARVSSYMGSEQLKKSSFHLNEQYDKAPEKINNRNFNYMSQSNLNVEPRKFKPQNKYFFDKNSKIGTF